MVTRCGGKLSLLCWSCISRKARVPNPDRREESHVGANHMGWQCDMIFINEWHII